MWGFLNNLSRIRWCFYYPGMKFIHNMTHVTLWRDVHLFLTTVKTHIFHLVQLGNYIFRHTLNLSPLLMFYKFFHILLFKIFALDFLLSFSVWLFFIRIIIILYLSILPTHYLLIHSLLTHFCILRAKLTHIAILGTKLTHIALYFYFSFFTLTHFKCVSLLTRHLKMRFLHCG